MKRLAKMRRRWAIGIDFGGTFVKLGAVHPAGRVALARVVPTAVVSRPAPFLDGVTGEVRRMCRQVGISPRRLAGVGIGAPGLVDAARGVVRSLVNVPGWRDVALAERLSRRLGCRCAVDNDANLYVLGEWWAGAGARARSLFGLTLGTGVGGGLVLDGRVYHGANGSAGEFGHTLLAPGGARCACGSRGCLEAYLGTAAILRMARRAMRRGAPRLRRLMERSGGPLTPAVVSAAAREGDPAARAIWREVGCALGMGLSSLINLLNPDRIVIGGGVANAWPFFMPAVRATVRRQAMPAASRAAAIVRAQLGDRAGILGAAVLIWRAS